jgi:3-hydroxyacyl-CoA dehydrogenase / enoyl-CoA hydratase / 3-hydroxybutyryl-CoA epimerase
VSSAFELNVEAGGLATLTLDVPGKKLNVFTREVIEELAQVTEQLAGRRDVEILVLLSGKDEGFIAGADIDMIAGLTDPAEAESSTRQGQAVFRAWEELPFPTVAAIRGTCVGGGLELALACTYRVMADRPQDRIGLPEIQLGIIPALGGSTRLPRLIGLPEALDIILAGKTIPPKKAYKLGLLDALLPEASFRAHVRDFALEHKGKKRGKEALDVKKLLLSKNPMGRKVVFDKARSSVLERTGGHYPAPLRALDVIRTGLEDGRDAGFAAEARAMGELAITTTAKNLIHVFGLTQEAKKWRGLDGGEPVEVHQAAVLGAGAMGGGIAQLVAHELDVPVRLKDISEDALASGMEEASQLFGKLEQRRRLTAAERRRKMALLQPTLENTGLGRVDVLVEAIVENMEIKQKVLAEVEKLLPEHAVLATNTSSLSVEGIGARTERPERVVGMHFFNPVHKMPLVEVVAPEGVSPEAVNTIFKLSKDLGKTPVLVKDAPGFLVNRLLTFYSIEAMWLVDEGYSIEDVDRVLKNWGWPIGPIALGDEVGLDVSVKVGHVLHEAFPDRLPLPGWIDRLVEAKRLGKKTQSGFYRYEDGKRVEPDPAAYRILGLEPTIENPDPRTIIDRTVLPMVDEAARCLDEGIVRTAAELDLAMIFGTGFPPFRGGLARWADRESIPAIVEALERFAEAVDERYAPSRALRDVAEAGGFYDKYGSGED